jgi:hypothetical protein
MSTLPMSHNVPAKEKNDIHKFKRPGKAVLKVGDVQESNDPLKTRYKWMNFFMSN